jgi:hypothetical protein
MKQKIKICLDMVMVILLPVLMAELLVGKMLHEWMGLLMMVIFVAHHVLNFGWIKNLFKGTYSLSRAFTTCINFLLLVVMVSLAVSGAMMSSYVFVWLNITSGLMFARKLHLVSSFWGLIVMSMHLGVHIGMASSVLRRKFSGLSESVMKVISVVSKIILLAVCAFGVYSFAEQNVANYLFLKQMFMFYDFTRPTIVFLAEYASMIVLFATIGYYINKMFRKVGAKHRLLKRA